MTTPRTSVHSKKHFNPRRPTPTRFFIPQNRRVQCIRWRRATALLAGSNPTRPRLKKETRHFGGFPFLMGRITGFEPATPGTTNQCSNQLSYIRHTGGADRTRTDDPLHAMQVLYQLSYNPMRGLILYFFLPNVKSIC